MDSKLREGDSLVEIDNSAKKKFKFKSFKKLFVKKKRKEPLPSLISSGLKQSQSASDVTTPVSMHTDYDSEDDIGDAASVLGSRAVSHDSIFIPEMQEPARPMRVFSQESVSDRIKALQLRLHSNIRIGPPPFGILSKRTEDPGTSSEDDGLPRSPPEMSLIHESIKTRISEIHRHHSSLSLGGTGSEEEEQVSSETSSRPLSPEETKLGDEKSPPESSDRTILSPSADFSTPPQFSTFLDNSAARHRLSVKPKNQRSSKMRRPSAALQEESVVGTNYIEEEDVTAPSRKQKDTGNVEVLTPNKVGSVCGNTDDCPSKKSTVHNSKKQKEFASEITLKSESQSLPEELQNKANKTSTSTQQSQNNRHTSTIEQGDKINISDEFVDRLNLKRNENTSSSLSITGKDVGPVIPIPSIERYDDIKNPDNGNEKSFNNLERFPPMLRTMTTVHSQEYLQSRRGCFRHSMSERGQNISEQPLSDKENNIKLGSMDTKADQSPTDIGAQRKFSVSSAWERPRTNSFTLKTNIDSDAPKSTTLSLLKLDVSKTENIKEEYKSAGIQTENKHVSRKKEILADLEAVPADQAISGTISSKEIAAPAVSDLSVATDTEAASEDRSPVKLRLPLLSRRYRDGLNPVSVKRHSAEIKLEKTGCLLYSKDETCEAGHTDLAVSRKREAKCKVDTAEVVQTKPLLARKPVLQNITSADNNMNKDVTENVSSQEKNSKSTEAKTEEKLSERRLSVRKNIEKPPSSVLPAEPGKGIGSKEQQPSWMSIARQKQLSFKEEHPIYKQKTVNQEAEKQNERTEAQLKQQSDQIQSKKTNTVAAIVPETYGQETSTEMREPRQRANTFPHPVHGTNLSMLTEKEEKTLFKRPTLSFSEEPSWMELAKKKSQAWSDMPQIIK